jgi:transcriptional regulator with XRE-family HTH domain
MIRKVNISTSVGANAEQVSAAVSRKLKLYRKQNRFTLDELSRRSGISKGMLVEMEKGSANPSVATLCKAAAALGVSVADFVDVASDVPAQVMQPQASSILWHGPRGGSATLLAETQGPDMVELWRWMMFPGEVYESPGHSPGTVELINVESGELTLSLQDTKLLVTSGSSVLARTEAGHSYLNSGSTELRFVMSVVELQRIPLHFSP